MNWQWYELRYRALSPLHVGFHKLGMVQRTRSYVPGRALWGAITSHLARTVAGKALPLYQQIGQAVHAHLRFTYLFPWVDEAQGVLVPRFHVAEDSETQLFYGTQENSLPAREFERRFIYALGQTAVAPESQTALDASLHESEFLAHLVKLREGEPFRPVYFCGYLGVAPDFSYREQLWPAIRDIAVGGDRSYGYGRLRLEVNYPRELQGGESLFGWQAGDLSGERVTWTPNWPVPAHVKCVSSLAMAGDIEPLVGREIGDTGFGQVHSLMQPCWVPGSVPTGPHVFTIGHYGIWHHDEDL